MRQSDALPSITTLGSNPKMRGPIAALMFDGAKALGAVALAYATTPATAAEQTPVTVPTYTHMQGISPVCHKKPAGESLTPAGELLRAWLASNLHTQTNDCLLNRLSQLPDVQQKLQQLYGAGSPFLAHDLAHYGEHLLEILHSDELMQVAREVHQRLPQLPFSAQEIVLLQLTITDPETAIQLLDTVNTSPEVHITPENSTVIVASLSWYIAKSIGMRNALEKLENPEHRQKVMATQEKHTGLVRDKKTLGLMYTTPKPGQRAEAMWIRADGYQEKVSTLHAQRLIRDLAEHGYTMQEIIGSEDPMTLEIIARKLHGTSAKDVIERWSQLRTITPFDLYTAAGIIGNQIVWSEAIKDLRAWEQARKTTTPTTSKTDWQELTQHMVHYIALNTHDNTTIAHYHQLAQNCGLRPQIEQPKPTVAQDEGSDNTSSMARLLARELSETTYTSEQQKLLKHPSLTVRDARGIDWSNIIVEYTHEDLRRVISFLDQIHAYDPKKVIDFNTLNIYFLDRHGRTFDAMRGQEVTWSPEYASDLATIIGQGGSLSPSLWGSILRGRHLGVSSSTQTSSDAPVTKMHALLDRTHNEASFTPEQRANYIKLLSLLDLESFSSSEPITLLGVSSEAKALFTDAFLKYLADFKKQTGEARIQFTDIGFHYWLTTQPKLRTTYLGMGRSTLEQRIKIQLTQRRHLTRTMFDSVSQEQLTGDLNALSIVNLIKIDLLLQGLQNPKHVTGLLAGMHKDFADTTTEYGGLLQFGVLGDIALRYDASLSNFDGGFTMTPDTQVNMAMNSGFAFHFHAVKDTGDMPSRIAKMPYYSGPSGTAIDYGLYGYDAGGDMYFANQGRTASVVFTLVDHDRFKADIFLPGNKTLSLGVYAKQVQ